MGKRRRDEAHASQSNATLQTTETPYKKNWLVGGKRTSERVHSNHLSHYFPWKKKQALDKATSDKDKETLYAQIDQLISDITMWGFWHRSQVMNRRGFVSGHVGAADRYAKFLDRSIGDP